MRETAGPSSQVTLRPLSWSRSPWLHAAAISLFTLIVLLLYQPGRQPILGDQPYLIYMAQTVFRGERLYAATTLGYTPLGIFISAGAMHLGDWLSLPTYLAPRVLSLLIAALGSGLLYWVTRRATRSVWAGLIAGLGLIYLDFFAVHTVSNLEPKILVHTFSLVAVAAVQRRRWSVAAFAAGLAAMTWQAAALVTLALFLVCLGNARRQGWSILLHFGAGFLLSLFPVLIYLSLTNQWSAFVQQAVLFKLLPRPDILAERSLHSLRSILASLRAFGLKKAPLPILAAAGFLAYAVRLIKRGHNTVALYTFHPRFGGLVPLTVFSAAYLLASTLARVEHRGATDLLPFLYLIIFWAAVGSLRVARRVRCHLRRRAAAFITSEKLLAAVALFMAISALLNVYQVDLPYTLAQQRALVNDTLSGPAADAPFLAINAVHFYVLTGRPSPWRTLYITPYFMDLIERQEESGCPRLLQDMQERQYPAVVVGVKPSWENPCLDQLLAHLQQDPGYRQTAMTPQTTQPCGTSDLIWALLRNRNTGQIDLGEWWRCLREQWQTQYRVSGTEETLIFRR